LLKSSFSSFKKEWKTGWLSSILHENAFTMFFPGKKLFDDKNNECQSNRCFLENNVQWRKTLVMETKEIKVNEK
jgi:hypothetical protein